VLYTYLLVSARHKEGNSLLSHKSRSPSPDDPKTMQDFLQVFAVDEDETELFAASKQARKDRVASARAASKLYTPKVEHADWFLQDSPQSSTPERDTVPSKGYPCHRLYRRQRYLDGFRSAVQQLHDLLEHREGSSSDTKLAEILDSAMRCAMSAVLTAPPHVLRQHPTFNTDVEEVLQLAQRTALLDPKSAVASRFLCCALNSIRLA